MGTHHVGMIVPSSNRTMETELPRMLAARERGIGVLAGVAVCFMLYRGTQPATSYAIVQGTYYPLALLPSALSQLLAMAGGTLAMMAYCWAMRQPGIGARAGALKLASMLALAVYGRYEAEGADFVPAYLELLGAGGSRSPEELGQIVGVDLADPGFWDTGLALVERQLEAAEQAARDAGRLD